MRTGEERWQQESRPRHAPPCCWRPDRSHSPQISEILQKPAVARAISGTQTNMVKQAQMGGNPVLCGGGATIHAASVSVSCPADALVLQVPQPPRAPRAGRWRPPHQAAGRVQASGQSQAFEEIGCSLCRNVQLPARESVKFPGSPRAGCRWARKTIGRAAFRVRVEQRKQNPRHLGEVLSRRQLKSACADGALQAVAMAARSAHAPAGLCRHIQQQVGSRTPAGPARMCGNPLQSRVWYIVTFTVTYLTGFLCSAIQPPRAIASARLRRWCSPASGEYTRSRSPSSRIS